VGERTPRRRLTIIGSLALIFAGCVLAVAFTIAYVAHANGVQDHRWCVFLHDESTEPGRAGTDAHHLYVEIGC
jgi:hypothetical protein